MRSACGPSTRALLGSGWKSTRIMLAPAMKDFDIDKYLAEINVVVDDLGSKNGTYLNGTRITQRRTVHTGDRIQTGNLVLEAQ